MSSKMNHRQRAGKSSRPPRRSFKHHFDQNPDGPSDPMGFDYDDKSFKRLEALDEKNKKEAHR